MATPPMRRPNFRIRISRAIINKLRILVGAKCCVFWVILSVWGFVQLLIMAVMYNNHAVNLLGDFMEHGADHDGESFDIKSADKVINCYAWTATLNCIVAAVLYFTCGAAAFYRITVLKRRVIPNSREYKYKGSHNLYMMYDVGARSDNKVAPGPKFY